MAFKMKGHTLPGIKQRKSSKPSDGKATSSPYQKTDDSSPTKKTKGDPASVTNRLNEGDKKGANLERRRGKAASKGNKSKAKRLARKLAAHDATDNRGKQEARTTEVKQGGRIQF
jgi:hypothetical protein